MATAAPFVKLLRQLSSAKDEYRSGALDITWDGTKATLFLVFGQPNHATYEQDGEPPLEGNEALAALLHNLPKKFTVASWRKAVVRNETLKMSLDELMEPFAQLAGTRTDEEVADEIASAVPADDQVGTGFPAEFEFSVDTFPLLPMGEPMWSDAAVNVVHLDLLIPKLPSALIVLTGPRLRAAALTLSGQLIDAVWVDDEERFAGEGAAMALMGAREGTVSCYRIEDNRFVEALTMLWRCPPRYRDISVAWLNTSAFLNSLASEQRDCAVRIDGPTSAVAFFMGGHFIGAYTSEDRVPTTSLDPITALLESGVGTITILQRASDRAIGAVHEEAAYHVPAAAAAESAPSYADGAAAAGASDVASGAETGLPAADAAHPAFDAEEAATEPEPAAEPEQPAWAEAQPAEAEPAEAAPSWASAPSEAGEPAEPAAAAASSDADEVVDDAASESGEEIASAFFGASPTEENGAGTTAPDWFSPASEAEAGQTAEEPAAGEPAATGGGWGDTAESGAEAASPFNAWGAPAGEEAASPTPEETEEPVAPFTSSDLGAANHAGEAAASPFLFGIDSGGSNGSTTEPAAPMSDDEAFAGPRLELDFDTIKDDLIQIGVLWLGSEDVAPVADLIRETRPSVDAFVATIDAIKSISVAGHDPSVIRAMAREMHYHAAEYLSGA